VWPGRAPRQGGRRPVLAVLLLLAPLGAGCAGVVIPPTYTDGELALRCQLDGGWWRPNDLMGGYCEFESGGFE
jgi:hypothetical protein